jgi:hypothetical protein
MKLFLPLLIAATLVRPGPVAAVPECTASLTLPDSAQKLEVRWRQLADAPAFHETEGLDAKGLHALRVQCVLAQGGQLRSDAPLRAGDVTLAAGTRAFGFTVALGGAPHFFAVDGENAVDLVSTEVKPGFSSAGLLMQWVWLGERHAQLVWQLGDRAGAVDLRVGAEPAPPAPRGG